MAKFKDFVKGFDIRSNATWDFIKWALGGGTLITALYTAVVRFFSSIPLDLAIILGLFVTSFAIISIIHLLQKYQSTKNTYQDKIEITGQIQTNKPIYAMFGIIVVFALAGFFIGKSTSGNFVNSFSNDKSLELIKNRTFNNEKIELDGREYIGCTFNNVTFEYNGTAAFSFTDNRIKGNYRFSSGNMVVIMTSMLFQGLTSTNIRLVDSNGEPLKNITPPETPIFIPN